MSSIIMNNKIFVNGKEIPPCPYASKGHNNITVINNHVYVNGYEYKNGKWVKTLKALYHQIF